MASERRARVDRSCWLGVRKGVKSGLEDVIAFLDEVEGGEVEFPAVTRVSGPSVEVAAVRQVVVGEAGDDPRDKWMTVAVTL